MHRPRRLRVRFAFSIVALVAGVAAPPTAEPGQAAAAQPWRDPSPHQVRSVTVDGSVQLEILDWGGSGRPIVLLAGAGNTAHVYDDFAPKLTALGHVYGLTRRGFGGSSPASSGYAPARLGEDVREALAALNLTNVVLVGHSLAGQEMSHLANTDRSRLAGLVYLDAAYRYALHRPGILENVRDLKQRLGQLEAEIQQPPRPPAELGAAIERVMGASLEEVQQDIRDLRAPPPFPGRPPAPGPADLATTAAYQAWSRRVMGWALPEAELRLSRDIAADGAVGPARPQSDAFKALTSAGATTFTAIPVPMLAVYASPHGLGPWSQAAGVDQAQIEAFARFDRNMTERQAQFVERTVPTARVVRLAGASHYLFLSNADDVVRECAAFIASLR